VPRRRRSASASTSRKTVDSARDRAAPEGIGERLERLESLLREILQNAEVHSARLTALQAQIDHLSAKSRHV